MGLGRVYDEYAMKMMLCPDPNTQMNISESQGLTLEMEKCTPSLNPNMALDAYLRELQQKADGL